MIPIFMALDTADLSVATNLLNAVGNLADVKVGLEFFISQGMAITSATKFMGTKHGTERRLFLDLKFHDIPNTVAGAVRALQVIEPNFLTVHACSGINMMKAAVDAVDGWFNRPKMLGVTLLTSEKPNTAIVLKRAWDAYQAGMDGLVCSPLEVELLRKTFAADWPEMFLMVPGIRSAGIATNDQVRTATPREAQDAGASALVIGREITNATDSVCAIQAIQKSLTD